MFISFYFLLKLETIILFELPTGFLMTKQIFQIDPEGYKYAI